MRSVLSFFLILGTFASLPLMAQAQSAEKAAFMRQGLQMVTSSLEYNRKDFGFPSSSSCPASGFEVIENLTSRKGKIMTAVDSVDDILDSVKLSAQAKLLDNKRCGSCQQWNLISPFASVNPEKTVSVPQCAGLPAETFAMVLQDGDEIKSMTEEILTGRNSEGRRLQRACPDPCAYYITTAQTDLGNGKKHLTLTVQCGQPRQHSIFSAVYEFKAGLIHQWSCAPFPK